MFGINKKVMDFSYGLCFDEELTNTMMEAVNYMAKRGWKVDRTYNISEVGLTKQAVIHYLLVKYVTDDKEIDDGLKLQVKD